MAVVASAPGKVLMTGGYLILERPNPGLVLSTNARFFAIVKPLHEEIKPDNWAWAWSDVKLTSPQMSRESFYKLALKNVTLQCVSSSDSRNPFVEQAVQYAVAAAHATFDKNKKELLHKLLLQGLDITILGSNEFYSYRNQIEARGLPLTPEALAALPPFSSITFNIEESNAENCKPEVAKTGLGSSAAMTTAVVAALLHYLGVVNLSSLTKDQDQEKDTTDLDIVHMIAQTAHCIAQGKVGSGFDVSSAVYGSQRYVRFSPEVISSAQVAAKGLPLEEVIVDILKGKWDHERTKFSLPPLMTLLLGEPGTGGSSTPSMVGAVKKWQKSDPQKSLDTWRKLLEANSSLEVQFNMLSKLAEEHWDAYKCIIDICSRLRSDKWLEQASEPTQEAVVKALLGARDAMLGIRYHMRQMGEAADVPIEPETQTRLLDATMNMEGILLAGVPGAGGFDAIFAVTLGDSGSNVTKVWSSVNVLALLVREDPRGVSLESGDPRTIGITAAVSSVHI
ncbi:phosphomevalonate kinase, peroxisomal [Alnus glutinosa]|uniref:phosphomevalonate kinase, peroxisomal n=1 Tax=Alnus glutinosa TaxID=3517 RepID=UPI002D769FB6|nr:phosphomevalonate kinase, peroxisomal [Alnus glutinosa]